MKILYFITLFLTVCSSGFAKIELDSEEIQLLIDSICANHSLPGVQVGIKDTETESLWSFSAGFRDKKVLDPLENTHLMQIGSTTKSFIASLALHLEADSERGLLGTEFNIEQTLGDWLPQYPGWQDIKIKNLLNMTSGIYNYTEDNNLFLGILKEPKRVWQDSELIAFAYSQNPGTFFPQGTKFSYCNTNYILVGMILEKVSGLPLETLFNERIFKKYPEYFKHTSYSPKTYLENELPKMARGYAMHPTGHGEFYGQDITEISLSWAGAAGAITSTASDLANWTGLLFSKDFLPENQREKLESLVCVDANCEDASPLPKDSKSIGYSLGVARLYVDPEHGYAWTHTGGTLGFSTLFFYLPQKSMVISVIVTQMGPEIENEQDVIFIAEQIFGNITF